eukprot:4040011-Pleurochrysis_carterae.AAC.1
MRAGCTCAYIMHAHALYTCDVYIRFPGYARARVCARISAYEQRASTHAAFKGTHAHMDFIVYSNAMRMRAYACRQMHRVPACIRRIMLKEAFLGLVRSWNMFSKVFSIQLTASTQPCCDSR